MVTHAMMFFTCYYAFFNVLKIGNFQYHFSIDLYEYRGQDKVLHTIMVTLHFFHFRDMALLLFNAYFVSFSFLHTP